jgi:hypothetical protein
VEETAGQKDTTAELIGTSWKPLNTVATTFKDLREVVLARKTDLAPAVAKAKPLPDFAAPCDQLLNAGYDRRRNAIAQAYLDQSIAAVQTRIYFPYVMPGEKVPSNWNPTIGASLIAGWERDFAADQSIVPDEVKSRLTGIKNNLEGMKKGPEDYAKLFAENKKEQDRYNSEMKDFKYNVSVQQQAEWYTAEGKDVYGVKLGSWVYVGSFTHNGQLTINLSKPGGSGSVTVSAKDVGEGEQRNINIKVTESGPKPKMYQYKEYEPPFFTAPRKSDILQKLQGK